MDIPTPDAPPAAAVDPGRPGPPSRPAASPAGGTWWDRLAEWRGRLPTGGALPAVAGVAGALAAVVVAVLLLRAPSGPPPQLTLPRAGDGPAASPGGATGGTGPAGPGGDTPPPAVATVHAAGAVAHPGVYAVPATARVADVLAAAGGPLPEADLDRLNLAAKVADGDRLLVPRKGDPPAGAAGGPGETGATGSPGAGTGAGPTGGGGAAGGAVGPLDLNTATAEQLDTLPGVGPATARSIITYRTRVGRFRSVSELLEVPGIGPAKLEALRPLVRV